MESARALESTANDGIQATYSVTPSTCNVVGTYVDNAIISGERSESHSSAQQADPNVSHIGKLPPEVHLRILADLPACDIQQCRRLDGYFRSLIDNPQNNGLCTGPGVARSLERLEDEAVRVDRFPLSIEDEDGMPTAFLTTLTDYINYHGLTPFQNQKRYCTAIGMFAMHWFFRWHDIQGAEQTSEQKDDERNDFVKFVCSLLHFHMKIHARGCESEQLQVLLSIVALTSMEIDTNLQTIGITNEDQKANFIIRILAPPGVFAAASFNKQYTPPKRPGTSPLHVPRDESFKTRLRRMLDFSELIDIPTLHWTTPASWYVSSPWAVMELENALINNIRLNHVTRAAILEETFIYWDAEIGNINISENTVENGERGAP